MDGMGIFNQATIRQSSPSLGKFSCGILESHTNKAPLGTTIFERRPCRQSHLCSWVPKIKEKVEKTFINWKKTS